MNQNTTLLPDIIADASPSQSGNLNWVGMEKIALPIQFPLRHNEFATVTAFADIFVSLDADVKGIHMSRLHLNLLESLANKPLSFNGVSGLLERMLQSQNDSSHNAMLSLKFDLPLEKPALVTENSGFQAYPLQITQQLVKGRVTTFIDITIPYSSTCPCSASLARQLITEAIDQKFAGEKLDKAELLQWLASENSQLATPHNQRSYAYIKLTISDHGWPDFSDLILQLESAIGTPVQTTVKREDEQAFAKLNGENLMFCEDAARKLDSFLNHLEGVADYWFKVEHQESLHAHNAVVIHQKKKEPVD